MAQSPKTDSIEKMPVKVAVVEKSEKEGSVGGLVMKIGVVLWDNLKQRLNVEGIKDGLEAKRDKVLGRTKEEEPED